MRFAGEAMSGNYSDAASNSGSDIFKQMSANSPKYDSLANASMVAESSKAQNVIANKGKVASTGIQSLGNAVAAMNGAQAKVAAAESQASATRQNGMMDMFGSIGGGALGALKPKVAKTDFGNYAGSNFDLNKSFW